MLQRTWDKPRPRAHLPDPVLPSFPSAPSLPQDLGIFISHML